MLLKAQTMGLSPPKITSPLVAGRLGKFIDTWKVLTSDLWVLQGFKGFQILPQPGYNSNNTRVSSRTGNSNEGGAQVTIREGSNSPSDRHSQGGFYSNLFLVPKKNGQMRPVINLKWLNEWVTTEHFKKEGISTPKDILQ